MSVRRDGDDDDQPGKKKKKNDAPAVRPQDAANVGDDIGERIGEGHDEIEDQML